MIQIVTDGTVELPPGWAQKYQIHILPIIVRFGNQNYNSGADLSPGKFYQLVEQNRSIPKTVLPSPGAIVDFYRAIAKKGDKVLSIHASSKLSNIFSLVEQAAREIKNDFTVTPYDSKSGSIAMGFMCREARIMEMAGYNIQAMANQMDAIRRQLTVVFTLDTMDYARSSGKVTTSQGLFGQFMNVKPVVVLKDGALETVELEKTRANAILRVIQVAVKQIGKKEIHLAVVHANAAAASLELVSMARERFNCREVVISELAVPVAAALGPGTLGIVAYPDAISY
jgi:DegV family protein with EDD domain